MAVVIDFKLVENLVLSEFLMLGADYGEEDDGYREQDKKDTADFVGAGSLLGRTLATIGGDTFVLVFVVLLGSHLLTLILNIN